MGRLASIDLFSGVGGVALALRDVLTTKAYCEIGAAQQAVLRGNIRLGELEAAPIASDIRTLSPADVPGAASVRVITASFPCQDTSKAGGMRGVVKGERSSLVFQVFRLLDEMPQVRVAFLENTSGVVKHGADVVVRELRRRGFHVAWGIFSANEVGALHERRRWYCMAVRGGGAHLDAAALFRHPRRRRFAFSSALASAPRLVRRVAAASDRQTRQRVSLLGNAVVPDTCRRAWAVLGHVVCTAGRSIAAAAAAAGQAPLVDRVWCEGAWLTKPPPATAAGLLRGGLEFSNGARKQLWVSPVHNLPHTYARREFEGRNQRVLANQVFHEVRTMRRFRYRDVLAASKRWIINPEWVEALMGFPRGWTAALHEP